MDEQEKAPKIEQPTTPEAASEKAEVAPEKSPTELRVERLQEIDEKMPEPPTPEKVAGALVSAEQQTETKFQSTIDDLTEKLGVQPNQESQGMIKENIAEESEFAIRDVLEQDELAKEQQELVNQNRAERTQELEQALAPYADIQQQLDAGWKGKQEILNDPEKKKQLVELKKLQAEKLTLDVMPGLEETIPGLEYFVTKDIATEMPVENSTQVLVAVVEPSPDVDPQRQTRVAILKEMIKRGLNGSVALGEKFSADSEKDQAFLDFVFVHKGADGKFQSQRPQHEILSEADRPVVIGSELPKKRNEHGTFKEISPEDFEPAPSFPEHFRDDIIFNGIYLRGADMARKLDTFTNKGELTPEQQQLVASGKMQENHFFTPEQARQVKQARANDLRQAAGFGQQYFGGEILDPTTLQELQKDNPDSIDFNQVLAEKSEAELGAQADALKIKPELAPTIEGLPPEAAQQIAGELLKDSLFSHAGASGKMLKNELFAYPPEVQTDVPITILANSPRLIEATKKIVEQIRQQGGQPDRQAIHGSLVGFMKKAIADFKGKPAEEYWKGHDQYEVVRPGF